MLDGHAWSAVKVSVAIQYSVVVARNGYIRNVVVWIVGAGNRNGINKAKVMISGMI